MKRRDPFIYFILSQGKVKIGVSTDVKSRFSHIQVSSPEKMTLLKFVPGDYIIEAVIHKLFSEQHVRGEWYHYDEDLEDFIDSLDDCHSLRQLLPKKDRMQTALQFKRTKSWPDPSPEMLTDPEFEAIWQTIKDWDIHVPGAYSGYCGATGNHVRVILDALRKARK